MEGFSLGSEEGILLGKSNPDKSIFPYFYYELTDFIQNLCLHFGYTLPQSDNNLLLLGALKIDVIFCVNEALLKHT